MITVTLTTASILGLIFIWLCMRVISVRVKHEALIGDEGKTDLLFAIRTHGNFTEYTPIFLILLGALELSGANTNVLWGLAALFVAARLSHIPGMGENANLRLRQAGVLGSFLAIIAACLYGLYLTLLA